MPRAKQVKSKAVVGLGRTSRVLVLAWLVLCWARPVLSAEEPAAPEPSMQLAPIRLGFSKYGRIDYLLRYDEWGTAKTMQQTLGLTVGVGVRAESFIWQPWLVRVGTHVNAVVGTETTDSARNSLDMTRSGESLYRIISGGAGLRLFPSSRFPSAANFERSDNRREIGLVKRQYAMLTDRFDLSQNYRSRTGRYRHLAMYKLSRSEDLNSRVGNSKLFNLDISLVPFRKQMLLVNFIKGRDDSMFTGDTFWNSSLISRHTYQPGDTFSVATLASLVNTNYRLAQGDTGLETLQFSSAGTWRPDNSRLTITGGMRLFETSSSFNGVSVPGDSFTGANLGANYAWTDWLRLYGSADISDRQGTQTVSSLAISNLNLSIAAQHRPKTIKLGNFNYNRFIAASVSNSTSTTASPSSNTSTSSSYQVFSMRLQHGLDNSTILGAGSLASTMNQGVSTTASSRGLPSVKLTHNGSLSWQKGGGVIRLSGNDARDLNGTKGFFQNINLQGNQTENLKGSALLYGDLTVNASRQGYDAAPTPTTDSLTSTASLNYTNQRMFKVPRLKFKSTLRVISADLLQSNDLNQNAQNQGQYSWENDLTYAIGKLQMELKGLVEEVQASKRATLMFHVNRRF